METSILQYFGLIKVTAPLITVNPNEDAIRWKMGKKIFDFEAEYRSGHLAIETLPANDGGGAREVAGINMKYDSAEESVLEQLVKAGKYDEAENSAIAYILKDTDVAVRWCSAPAIESYLRDCTFNRGPHGCILITQAAMGVAKDGQWGPKSDQAEKESEAAGLSKFLDDLHQARIDYEHEVVGYRGNFDAGLLNRFQNACTFAKSLI